MAGIAKHAYCNFFVLYLHKIDKMSNGSFPETTSSQPHFALASTSFKATHPGAGNKLQVSCWHCASNPSSRKQSSRCTCMRPQLVKAMKACLWSTTLPQKDESSIVRWKPTVSDTQGICVTSSCCIIAHKTSLCPGRSWVCATATVAVIFSLFCSFAALGLVLAVVLVRPHRWPSWHCSVVACQRFCMLLALCWLLL